MATVIDCYTKACIGYAMAERMRADVVIDAPEMCPFTGACEDARAAPVVPGAIRRV